MNINSLDFSYPVLSSDNDDYLDSEFDVEYKLESKGFETKDLVAIFNIKDKVVEEYLEKDIFKLLVHIECPLTSYRKIYKVNSDKRELYIPIEIDKLRSLVQITSFIVSNKNLDEYINKNINRYIYGKNYYIKDLKKGSIIAATYTQNMRIKVNQDEFENFSSIIKVGKSKEKFLEVNLDDDVIVIHLPEKEYIKYVQLSNTVYSEIIVTSIIYPSLVYVLEKLSDNENISIYRDLNWFRVIESKLDLKSISIQDINERYSSIRLAQMILESPIERGLNSLEEEIERDEQ